MTLRLFRRGWPCALLALSLFAPAAGAKPARRDRQSAATRSPYIRKGLGDLERKEYDSAIENFAKAAKSRGDSASYFLLGYAHYKRGFIAGSPEEADKQDAEETVKAYTKALSLDPELQSLTQPFRLYHGLALSYEALGDNEKAVEAYKKAFQAAPGNSLLPLYAARLRYRMNDMEKSASNLALSLQKARLAGREAEITALVKTDPLFSIMMASPAHLEVLRESETPPREKAAEAPSQPRGEAPATTRARMSLQESHTEAAPERKEAPVPGGSETPSSLSGGEKPRPRKMTAQERRKIEADVGDLMP